MHNFIYCLHNICVPTKVTDEILSFVSGSEYQRLLWSISYCSNYFQCHHRVFHTVDPHSKNKIVFRLLLYSTFHSHTVLYILQQCFPWKHSMVDCVHIFLYYNVYSWRNPLYENRTESHSTKYDTQSSLVVYILVLNLNCIFPHFPSSPE
uniref:Uncharacterized protein n=1 Tax=Cacopsylla melanoneura TaxID=428564 RepID=A0A8D8ZRQ3_9HEMI